MLFKILKSHNYNESQFLALVEEKRPDFIDLAKQLFPKTKETIDYISRQNKKGSYNDFVHCIWYCVIRNRMESLEDEYLLKLRNSYSNVNMPIILIYLNEYSKTKITEMEDKIKEKLDVDFINVI